MTSDTVYIHYGDDQFRTMNPIANRSYFTKPRGGLWASRENDPEQEERGLTWRRWCEKEEFRLDQFDRYFLFKLKEGAKVLELDSVEQLENLPKLAPYNKNDEWSECRLDFEKLAKEYDAIEVSKIWRLYWALYGWDCDSILIMNPDIVDILEE